MTRAEFIQRARDAGVRDDVYDLFGGHLSERYTLGHSGRHWQVYYSERGLETGIKHFSTEDEALHYLLDALLEDPTTRM